MVFAQYPLQVKLVDGDSTSLASLQLKTAFPNRQACAQYVNDLPGYLSQKGLVNASVDSVQLDSASGSILLYLGTSLYWGDFKLEGMTRQEWLQTGLSLPRPGKDPFHARQLQQIQNQLLTWLSDNGYPFAQVQFDSVEWKDGKLGGQLVVDRGMYYTVDSIRVEGTARISDRFLHRYLDIPQGSKYSFKAFQNISPRLRELTFLREVKPWDIRFGGNGAIVDLYLEPQKSSQINVLVGLLPGTDPLTGKSKFQLTGEAVLNLKNALGAGETIGVNWQQLQPKSPRLNLLYQQPYLFGSAFGISTQFDLFKKDSSFLNLNGIIGLQYAVSARQTGKVFLQLFRTNLLTVDTSEIKITHQLPADMDMSIFNLGVDYELITTNYRRNPRKGWEFYGFVTAGTRTIRRNNLIVDIKDPAFDYASLYDTVKLNGYQFRLRGNVSRFFPFGRQSTALVKLAGGWVQSPSLYRNELFQIGGYKLLRGFNEESIYASGYVVNTLEYRYLVNMNSYFFVFSDLGFIANKSSMGDIKSRYWGLGVGMAFETTAGFFNLSLAAGKTDSNSFDLKQTKIHLGYVNYF
ncbi:hypothetical protein FPE01S_04_03730 [Flavihumibacter petaseus NBRC 106054]|uniref:Haemolysin activator HlyB C-terminal domain-containing protein n=1 Tax=Flavihumibacter petaseus NBRC 106054 TaxID=1220578 RepID=A0A0E9N707_9BACT|nr:hypothetical protein FPE01S_04_03730 [Flavihumibacter petaseus NBRC 106054]